MARETTRTIIDMIIDKISRNKKEKVFWKQYLEKIQSAGYNLDLYLRYLNKPSDSMMTRIDQIYEISHLIEFPLYSDDTLSSIFGDKYNNNVRIWRIILPKDLKYMNVLIRAASFQEAFAYANDYACRTSLNMHGKIFPDMTIRVKYVKENEIRKILQIRKSNSGKIRKTTPRQVFGKRICAIGSILDSNYSIMKYIEYKDLKVLRDVFGKARINCIETEIHRRGRKKHKKDTEKNSDEVKSIETNSSDF